MMSTGYLETKSRHPGALAAVVAIHAAGISALMMIAPTVYERIYPPLEGYNVPAPPIPPEAVPDPMPKVKRKTTTVIEKPTPQVVGKKAETGPALTADPGPLTGIGTGEGLGGGVDIIDIDPPTPPVIVGPQFTGRNAQPPYPPGMQRLNIEGAVTVRVLVGTDGRPVRIEMVRADQDAFFAATRDWGMKNWRFKPATRDGAPFQEWRTMTVRFEMNGAD
jgi:periplasmic protein TonB